MDADQPIDALAVVHVVVADMPDKAAYGYTDTNGEAVVCVDRAVVEGDPSARDRAFPVFVAQAAAAMSGPAAHLA